MRAFVNEEQTTRVGANTDEHSVELRATPFAKMTLGVRGTGLAHVQYLSYRSNQQQEMAPAVMGHICTRTHTRTQTNTNPRARAKEAGQIDKLA
jgi:hypothetical protein